MGLAGSTDSVSGQYTLYSSAFMIANTTAFTQHVIERISDEHTVPISVLYRVAISAITRTRNATSSRARELTTDRATANETEHWVAGSKMIVVVAMMLDNPFVVQPQKLRISW
tara:strand:+ start:170 stop:508 length:339 start_codon:yes stop_codon:yes gene_type:complete